MNITMIGMAGVGKSVVGRELARMMHYQFLDIDHIIENSTGMKLQQIIDSRGDDEFMKIEESAIIGLGKIDNHILSPGGSVVYCHDSMRFLKKNSIIVYLSSDCHHISKRVKNMETRGIVGLKNKKFEDLFNERSVLYKKYADIVIQMPENFNAGKVVKEIMQKLKEK